LAEALVHTIIWDDTEDGHEYWEEIYFNFEKLNAK